MNYFIVRNSAGVVALGVGVCSEAGVGDAKYDGVGERRGKVRVMPACRLWF